MWTKHERQSAFDRALVSDTEYVLPVRFDDTEIPALRVGTGYLDLRDRTPRELAEMIAKKVGAAVAAPSAGWEYQLFSDTVAMNLRKLKDKQLNHEMGYAVPRCGDHGHRRARLLHDAHPHVRRHRQRHRGPALARQAAVGVRPGGTTWRQREDPAPGQRVRESYENLLDWAAACAAPRRRTVSPRSTRSPRSWPTSRSSRSRSSWSSSRPPPNAVPATCS